MKRFIPYAIAALCAIGLFVATAPGTGSADPVPVCEHVLVQENSGNGPSYTIKLCGSTALPVKTIIIDGGPLPEKTSTTWHPVAIWSK